MEPMGIYLYIMKIKGIASTRQVYLNGIVLRPVKSQGYINLNPDGFAWGDNSSGSGQLALAILLEHYGAPINAIEQYEDFMRQFITPLPKGKDFEIEIHTWKPPSLN